MAHYSRLRVGTRTITAATVQAVVAEIVEESAFCLENGRNPLQVVAKRFELTAQEIAVIAAKALEAFEQGNRVRRLYSVWLERKAHLAMAEAFKGAA